MTGRGVRASVDGCMIHVGGPALLRELFRHYWVLIKLIITALATALLLLHLQPVTHMAGIASVSDLSPTDMTGMRTQLVADAAAAILALLVTTVLSLYKPRGITKYGRMRLKGQQPVPHS